MVYVLSDNTGVIAVYSKRDDARADKAKFEDRMPGMKITAVPFRRNAALD